MPKNVFNLCFGKGSSVDASVTWFEFLLCPIKMLMLKTAPGSTVCISSLKLGGPF